MTVPIGSHATWVWTVPVIEPCVGVGAVGLIQIAVWAGMAQRRQSQVIAGIAVLMGHFTIALATHSIDKPGPYSVAGIAFLSAGGAFFLFDLLEAMLAALVFIDGVADLVFDLLGGLLEFTLGLAEAAGELGDLGAAEEQKGDGEDGPEDGTIEHGEVEGHGRIAVAGKV